MPSVAVLLPPIEPEPPLIIEQALLSEYAVYIDFFVVISIFSTIKRKEINEMIKHKKTNDTEMI